MSRRAMAVASGTTSMQDEKSTQRLHRALDALRVRHGVDIGGSTVLRTRLEHAIAGATDADTSPNAPWSDDAIDALAARLRIGATRFFRDAGQDLAIGSWLAQRVAKTTRIFSVGCSTGEEAYTLAMIAADAGTDGTVLAIDVSPEAIARAKTATYPIEAKDALPAKLRRHLVVGTVKGAAKGTCVVAADIRSRVRFTVGDAIRIRLAERFDLIVCRNVAIYLASESGEAMLRGLADHLVDGGLLVVARAEVAIARRTGLVATTIGAQGPVAFTKS